MSASLNNKLRHARDLLQNGDANGARELCSQILGKAPRNPEALTLRGIAALMGGAAADAARDFRQALAAAPRDGAALEYLGLALLNLGDFAEAENVLQRASTLSGAPASVWMRLGLAVLHQGRAQESLAALKKAVALAPGNVDCLISLGRAMAAAGDAPGATAQFESVLSLAPGHPDAAYNLGVVRLDANDLAGARQLFADVLIHAPRNTDAMVNLAIVLERDGAPDAAADMLQRVLAIEPQHPHALANLGRLELVRGNLASAKAHYENALRQAPPLIAAIEGMATVCRAQGRYAEAVHWFRELTRREPALPTGWAALADNLLQTGDLDAADEAARKAGDLDPALASPYALRAQLRVLRGKLDEAVAILDEGFRKTDGTGLLGMLAQQCRHTCDWDRWSAAWLALKPRIIAGEDAGTPFALLSEDLTSRQLLDYTRTWANKRFGHPPAEKPVGHATRGDRPVRIGYLSSDFQEHPVAFLIAEVLELHDRSRFEVYAYSYGPPGTGAMRQRMISAVDHFVDIAWEPDDQAIERIRNDEIDILVDLKGYTVGDRLAIMAQRPSPVQVTWLGYPGTTGTAFIDYLIADPFIVPAGAEHTCSEQVVRMPHCYQPTDRKRSIADPLPRSACGLPDAGLVFCCFNQTFKITPDIFAAWMRLLGALPGSVLWLMDDNRWATANLRSAAAAAGIAPERLVFAPRVPLAEHLARYQVADLALDTFPYTSHTTASDALWCGCPLVALCGETFAARVSGSILAAAGLADLVTHSIAECEAKVIELATNAGLRQEIVDRVQTARAQAPLFDATAFARDLEARYLQMLDQQPATA
jgi:protein O-GlcNAc transferase